MCSLGYISGRSSAHCPEIHAELVISLGDVVCRVRAKFSTNYHFQGNLSEPKPFMPCTLSGQILVSLFNKILELTRLHLYWNSRTVRPCATGTRIKSNSKELLHHNNDTLVIIGAPIVWVCELRTLKGSGEV
jgi:hypothetical protein